MKNYNKSFNVEITANMIADKFYQKLAEFGKDSKDKDIQIKADKLIDSIVGPMCSNDNTNGLRITVGIKYKKVSTKKVSQQRSGLVIVSRLVSVKS